WRGDFRYRESPSRRDFISLRAGRDNKSRAAGWDAKVLQAAVESRRPLGCASRRAHMHARLRRSRACALLTIKQAIGLTPRTTRVAGDQTSVLRMRALEKIDTDHRDHDDDDLRGRLG